MPEDLDKAIDKLIAMADVGAAALVSQYGGEFADWIHAKDNAALLAIVQGFHDVFSKLIRGSEYSFQKGMLVRLGSLHPDKLAPDTDLTKPEAAWAPVAPDKQKVYWQQYFASPARKTAADHLQAHIDELQPVVIAWRERKMAKVSVKAGASAEPSKSSVSAAVSSRLAAATAVPNHRTVVSTQPLTASAPVTGVKRALAQISGGAGCATARATVAIDPALGRSTGSLSAGLSASDDLSSAATRAVTIPPRGNALRRTDSAYLVGPIAVMTEEGVGEEYCPGYELVDIMTKPAKKMGSGTDGSHSDLIIKLRRLAPLSLFAPAPSSDKVRTVEASSSESHDATSAATNRKPGAHN